MATWHSVGGDRYTAAVMIRSRPRPGRWQIEGIWLYDKVGNNSGLYGGALEQAGINASFDVASSSADTTPPVISDVSVQPASIDVSSAAQTVTFSATITDAGVGVCGDDYDSACRVLATSAFARPPAGRPSGRHGTRLVATATPRRSDDPAVGRDGSLAD